MTLMNVMLAALLGVSVAHADEGKAVQCTRLWALEKELGCPDGLDRDKTLLKETIKPQDFLARAQFGPSKCVIADEVDAEKKILKSECETWVKERKVDMGKDFVTSTCQAECLPCGNPPIFKQCTYTGEAHYRKEAK